MNIALTQLLLPVTFVVIYGSGFVGAKLGLPSAEPFTFLALRFALAAGILALIALWLRSRWPKNILWVITSGLLLQGGFSVGVFYALHLGMKPAVSALIIALQPLCVAVLAAPVLSEQVTGRRWLGLLIGFLGVAIVVADGLVSQGVSAVSLTWAIIGLLALSSGQLLQKRYCADMDLVSGGLLQTLSSAVAMFFLAGWFDSRAVQWNGDFIIALIWMGVGVSIGALSLLYLMLRYQSANQVASIFYGVPVAAALIAWPLFDQTPTLLDWSGSIVVAIGVSLAFGHGGSAGSRLKIAKE